MMGPMHCKISKHLVRPRLTPLWFASLCVALATLMATPAVAEEPDEETLRRAAEHFEQGAEHFIEERYSRALLEFRRAHSLNPHPILLYNKAIAYMRLDNPREGYARALAARDMGGLGQEQEIRNLARIDGLGAVMSARGIADKISADQLARQDDDDDDQDDPSLPPIDTPEPASTMGALAWTGVGVAVLGTGLLGFAGVTHLRLNSSIDDYQATENPEQWEVLRREIEGSQRQGQIALISGSAALVAGLSLFFIGRSSSSDSQGSFQIVGTAPSSRSSGAMIHIFRQF